MSKTGGTVAAVIGQAMPGAVSLEHPKTVVARTGGQTWALVKDGPPCQAPEPASDPVRLSQRWFELCSDEDEVVNALQEIDAMPSPAPPPAKAQQIQHPPPLSNERIAAIAAEIKSGKLKLPDIDLPNESGYVAVWSLLDSGSPIRAINHEKHVPGAKLKETEASRYDMAYRNADGSPPPNRGGLDALFHTDEGHTRQTTFQNASGMMPMLS